MIKGTVHLFGIDTSAESTKEPSRECHCQLASFARIGDLIGFLPDCFLTSPLLKRREKSFNKTFSQRSNTDFFQPENVIYIGLSDFAFHWSDNTSGELSFSPSHIRHVRGLKDVEFAVKKRGRDLNDEISIIFNVVTEHAGLIQVCEEIDTQMLIRNY
ncbi:hypothetical protein [Vibrio methylphosphonaticus]|uniref:hypothetical protein n=1 Tax=Vibrio methylphosphonaticus TaxID=2946866 RepID=UPI00202A6E23|nr:hypothetical protein [Vibrio methylphosphonaticus]MCL9775108.1 hypothetical protein [Vibrio methylphosphonaticus]